MPLITDNESLREVCALLVEEKYLAVDTEFLREKTYFPKLCLIQIAAKDRAYVIDVLADDIDLSPLWALLANPNSVKIFHSGRQDIEVIYNYGKFIPTPLFDTQIAASVCGYGDSIAYDHLVQELLQKGIDKSLRHTDWSKRPLSEKHIEYALYDVIYLREIYFQLKEKLENWGRDSWIIEETENLADLKNYQIDFESEFHKVKIKQDKPEVMLRIRELYKWREKKAINDDKPRNHIIKSDIIFDIAKAKPANIEELNNIRSFNKSSYSEEIIEILQNIDYSNKASIRKERVFNRELESMLRLLLQIRSAQKQVAEKVIANSEEIREIARGSNDIRPMQGWRYEIFGQYAEKFMKGEISIAFINGEIRLVEFELVPTPAPILEVVEPIS